MKTIVTGKQMKYLDENTSGYFHVPEIVLMEQAANSFVEELFKLNLNLDKVLVVSGNGNNGADGIAIARLLNQKGINASLCLLSGKEGTASYELQKKIYCKYNFKLLDINSVEDEYDIIIDAIFGIGLSRDITGEYNKNIGKLNTLSGTKISVDIASGISADDGKVMGIAFKADYTLTFSFGKLGHLLYPGSEYSGCVRVCKTGIDERSWLDERADIFACEKKDLDLLPKRNAHSNKGSYGRLLVIAGSKNMAGAAVMAAKAAYKSGAGLVKIYTDESNRIPVLSQLPEAILSIYTDFDSEQLRKELQWADGIVIGPGIGTSPVAKDILEYVISNTNVPLVIDADGINILSDNKYLIEKLGANMVITPHLGEMSRLINKPVKYIQENIFDVAIENSKKYNTICVLKDFRTIVACPDGEAYINLSGNNGMATAGSGDVLAGIIGSLIVQGATCKNAGVLGVYVHGCAGDEMVKITGTRGMTAGNIIEGLNLVWNQVEKC